MKRDVLSIRRNRNEKTGQRNDNDLRREAQKGHQSLKEKYGKRKSLCGIGS